MPKLMEYLGQIFNMEKFRDYQEVTIKFKAERDRTYFAKLMARYSMMIQPELEEDEVSELIDTFLKQNRNEFDVYTVHKLASIVGSTIYHPDKDILN